VTFGAIATGTPRAAHRDGSAKEPVMRTVLTTAAAVHAVLFAVAPRVASADDPQQPVDQTRVDPHITWSEVHFDFDSAELSDSGRAELMKAARWIQANPGATVLIEGYTDRVGTVPYNKRLAERRAATVRQFLLEHGAQPDQIRIVAYGKSLPVVETNRADRMNRRIVLTAVQKEPTRQPAPAEENVPAQPPAAEEPALPPAGPPAPLTAAPPTRRPLGFEVMAGGGVTGFIDDQATDFTDVGGMWTARVVGLTRSFVGFEAAYVGSAQGIDAIGVDGNATVVGNGVEGNLRLNFTRTAMLQPYVFAGLGWTHYDVTNTDINTASIDDSDDVLTIPGGAGVSLRVAQRVSFDLRGTVRAATGGDMFHTSPDDDAGMANWSASGQVGFAF
jgi:outer membrane protein OmpA-like peptidoglycan-associated protein/opacity protein-like surface antigen